MSRLAAIAGALALAFAPVATAQIAQGGGGSSGGSGITALTGDVTASGTGSVAATVVGAGGATFSTTTAQTYTFPTSSANLAGKDISNTWTASQVCGSGCSWNVLGAGSALKLNGAALFTNTAPTLSGCGTSATMTNSAGSAAFNYAVGTSPPTTCTITLPTASHGWICTGYDLTTATEHLRTTANSTTSCVVTYYNAANTATAPTASDNIVMTAMGY